MRTTIKKGLLITLLGLGLAFSTAVLAQEFPDKTVRIVVPYPPGGFNDTLARVVGERLSKIWSQAVLIDNRPGGNTTLGNNLVAKAPADGYTVLITPLPFSALQVCMVRSCLMTR